MSDTANGYWACNPSGRPDRSDRSEQCHGQATARLWRPITCLAALLLCLGSTLSAEPAGPKDELEDLFAEDEIKDVEFRFRTRFPRNFRKLDEQRVLYCYKIRPDEAPTIDGKIAVS